MKIILLGKKKNLIKSCLLGSALLLGTGYAVINSKNVTISGTVSAANLDLNISVSLGWDAIDFPGDSGYTGEETSSSCVNNICTLTFQTPENLFRNAGDEYPLMVMFVNEEKSNFSIYKKLQIYYNEYRNT